MIYNGQLLARVSAADFARLLDKSRRGTPRFSALFAMPSARSTKANGSAADWLVFKFGNTVENPWDIAHRAAVSLRRDEGLGDIYIEPDLMHEQSIGVVPDELDDAYPPSQADADPGWHLKPGYSNFIGAWPGGAGRGIRIAHLDTGYFLGETGTHPSGPGPANLKTELGWNFVEPTNPTQAIDPGLKGLLLQPWHGTSTMTLLAGREIDYTPLGGHRYVGYIGGAHDADVIPVRIAASVIHLFTSNMARGLEYACAPRGNVANRCHVISVSMGGLPSLAWAHAVDKCYDAGIVLVAAAGDSLRISGCDVPTHETIWPARFERAISAHGVTFDKKPYTTKKNFEVQGSWGPGSASDPTSIMHKAISAYTPNVYCAGVADHGDQPPYPTESMSFGGTSSATPQIAAACALWLERYRERFPAGPARVEACRKALLESSKPTSDGEHFGRGWLDVPAMLARERTDEIETRMRSEGLMEAPPADVCVPFYRSLFPRWRGQLGRGRMFEVEVAQLLARPNNNELAELAITYGERTPPPSSVSRMRALLLKEPRISETLAKYLKNVSIKSGERGSASGRGRKRR